jgi:hypothetical protein
VRLALCLLLAFASGTSLAQVYRWVDAKGTVHYSNEKPPADVTFKELKIDAKAGPASPDTLDCYTLRCQGERLEQRLARREEMEAQYAAQRAAAAPPPVRGLQFRHYISIQRGMSEGELLGIAGAPDLLVDNGGAWFPSPTAVQSGRNVRSGAIIGGAMRTYTYLPTSGDPYTTTITLIGGRVSELERIRKF